MERLQHSIEQFQDTLKTVEDVSKQTDNPAVRSILDRIYGVLLAAQEQLAQTMLDTQE